MHGNVVVINSDLLHTFGVIKDMVVDRFYSHYLVLEILHTIRFSSRYHAHEVPMNTPPLFELVKSFDIYMTFIFLIYSPFLMVILFMYRSSII